MAEQNERVYLLFKEVPEGTHYKKDHYSWVNGEKAQEYIEDGYAEPIAKEETFTLQEPDEVADVIESDNEED